MPRVLNAEVATDAQLARTPRTTARIFAAAFFPIALIGALLSCAYLMSVGYTPLAALLISEMPVIALIILFERVFPNRAVWNESQGDVLTDAGHTFTILILGGLSVPLIFVGGMWLSNAIGSDVWPSNWPLAAQFVLALVLAEAVLYWVHRLQHQVPLLWRFHSLHHSPCRLYWLNTYRFHIVDILMNAVPGYGLLIALGIGDEAFAMFGLATAIVGFFQHGNLEFNGRLTNWFFSTPDLHRWHHSNVAAESNHNYGQTVIVWDVLFGTRFLPESADALQIGMASPRNFPTKYLAQVLVPFRWKQLERSSR